MLGGSGPRDEGFDAFAGCSALRWPNNASVPRHTQISKFKLGDSVQRPRARTPNLGLTPARLGCGPGRSVSVPSGERWMSTPADSGAVVLRNATAMAVHALSFP